MAGTDPTDRPRAAPSRSGGARRLRDRGVSTTIAYTLSLLMATLLITGLVTAAGGFVEDERRRVVRTELGVVGQQLAGDLTATDRLVATGEDPRVTVVSEHPRRVVGDAYRIGVESLGGDRYRLVLTSEETDVTATVQFTVRNGLAETTVDGGAVTVTTTPTGSLQVTDD